MPTLVIKSLPDDIYLRLKNAAKNQHRSMTQQAIVVLDQGLRQIRPIPSYTPYKGRFPLTNELIQAAKREGRA